MLNATVASRPVHAPEMEKPKASEPRVHATWSPGDQALQGDLIFVALKALPKSAKVRVNRQLADGETRGSKHVVEGGHCYECETAEVAKAIKDACGLVIDLKYIGPVIAGKCIVTHPQHQHQALPHHCATAVVFQRNLDAEEREQRAQD